MRRLKGEDNSFLAWESSVQPQHTIKAVVLDPARGHVPLTFDAVRAAVPGLIQRIEPLQWQLRAPRFGVGRPWWLRRQRIDLDHHVRQLTASAPGGDRELAAVIATAFTDRLDLGHPAWQLFYVDGLAHGRVALVLKIHHAVADGMASLRLLEELYRPGPLPAAPSAVAADEQRPAPWVWFRSVATHQVRSLSRLPRIVSRTARVTGTIRRRQKAGKPGYAQAFTAPALPFNQPLTADRRFAFRSCDMAQIKRVAQGFGVTVNDVFLALCSSALREYLSATGQLSDNSLTVVVPVSMRPPGGDDHWGNQVARWNIELATDISDPVERLRAIASATVTAREVQAERDPWLQHDWMEYWPLFRWYSRVLPILGARMTRRPMFSLIASNMRGPQEILHFGGAPVEKLISSGPLVFPMGLNFTGWSYDGELTVSVLSCGDQVPDPAVLADALPAALAALLECVDGPQLECVDEPQRVPTAGMDRLPQDGHGV